MNDWLFERAMDGLDDAVAAAWRGVGERIAARLPLLTPAQLDAPAPGSFPGGDPSVLGALAFLSLHESYHLGQLGYLRRLLGREGVVA